MGEGSNREEPLALPNRRTINTWERENKRHENKRVGNRRHKRDIITQSTLRIENYRHRNQEVAM